MVDILVAPTAAAGAGCPPAASGSRTRPPPTPRGCVAHGGDLAPSTLIAAYRQGIFPWPYDEESLLWWSPDPRAVLPLDALHVSRSLARTLRGRRLRVTLNAALPGRDRRLRRPRGNVDHAGAARGLRAPARAAGGRTAWRCGGRTARLAGGLYGVAVGGLFAAESMFHRARDASKVALVALVQHARRVGIDAARRAGALAAPGFAGAPGAIPRGEYLTLLTAALRRRVVFAR